MAASQDIALPEGTDEVDAGTTLDITVKKPKGFFGKLLAGSFRRRQPGRRGHHRRGARLAARDDRAERRSLLCPRGHGGRGHPVGGQRAGCAEI